MILWILLFLLILVVFGFGFTMQILWWVAAVLLVVWIVGFAMRGRRGSASAFKGFVEPPIFLHKRLGGMVYAVGTGSAKAVEKQHAKGRKTARERIELLFDEGSFVELDELARQLPALLGVVALAFAVVGLLLVPVLTLAVRSLSTSDGWGLDGYRALAGTGFPGTLGVSGVDAADVLVTVAPLTVEQIGQLKPGAIVSDVGSVKGAVLRAMAPHLPKSVHFIPGHPVLQTAMPELMKGLGVQWPAQAMMKWQQFERQGMHNVEFGSPVRKAPP